MKRRFWIGLILAFCLAGTLRLVAQAPAGGDGTGSGQNQPSGDAKKPAATQPAPEANAFPEDTSNVPVMPSKVTPPLPDATYSASERDGDSGRVALPGEDTDPVRSPDDPVADSGDQVDTFSSSLKGMDKLLPRADDDQPGKKKKQPEKEPTHQEAAASDIGVGGYYLDKKNWKAALSRFESAMVLDPENPDVYWGLAEAERHLGDLAGARANYQKVVEYDPDSHHGKEARKALKEPEIANAKSAPPGQQAAGTPK